jgi:hypothetical protein
MSESQRQPAVVYVLEGGIQRRVPEGWYDDHTLGCTVDGVAKTWARCLRPGAVHEIVDGKPRRVFYANPQVMETDLPLDVLDRSVAQVREAALKAQDAAPAKATREERAKLVQEAMAARYGRDGAKLALPVFDRSHSTTTLGQVVNRELGRSILHRAEAAWHLVLGAVVFGILEGWQLADTVLPSISKNLWMSLLLPLLVIAGLFWLAKREG